jgi:lyso-ornithine lipid O-acyltransferase
MDVLVFSAIGRCVFVSKSNVRSWPILGSLARKAGTIFVDRTTAMDVGRANLEMAKALARGVTVLVFPEGTSSDGSTVLPFRSALFESAIRSCTPLTPARVSYELEGGSVGRDLCYWGNMVFASHLWKLLSKGRIVAWISFGEGLRGLANRKQAATLARESVVRLAPGSATRERLSARTP